MNKQKKRQNKIETTNKSCIYIFKKLKYINLEIIDNNLYVKT